MFTLQITPFIFALMTRKTQECYQHLFSYVDTSICSLSGASFITDYEVALRNALRTVQPDMQYFGCWFHFTQACKKNAKKISGFEVLLKTNNQLYTLFQKFLHLPLLPASKIIEHFNLLSLEVALYDTEHFEPFLKYFKQQWLTNVGLLD